MKRIDNIEIHPLLGMDEDGHITTDYSKVVDFDVTEENSSFIVAWGVYVHREGEGVENVFDTVDKKNAIQAQKLLMKLYNLK